MRIGKIELEKPIIQGGMAVRISGAELAAAVSEEGGLGVIAGSGMSEEEFREEIRKARSLTSKPIGVNLMRALSRFFELLKVALEEKVEVVIVGAGFSRDFISMCRDAGSEPVPVVSSEKAALISERAGASAVIVEAGEAGGHLGTLEPLAKVLPRVLNAVKLPVIAAGGILDSETARNILGSGASGIQLGTIFAASKESGAHPDFKHKYIEATEDDVVLIDSPAGLPGQAVRNWLVDNIISKKAKYTPKIIKKCQQCLAKCTHSFCILDALVLAQRGYVEEGLIFAGRSVARIKESLSVKEIFKKLGF